MTRRAESDKDSDPSAASPPRAYSPYRGESSWSSSTPRLDMLLTLLDALPPVAYWDGELRNQMANESFCEFFGVSADTVLGRQITEILAPDVAEQSLPHFDRALRGEPQAFDLVSTDRSGTIRHAQVQLTPDVVDSVVRGIISHSIDVTARREAEMALAATESQFKLTLMASPVGIATVRTDGRLTQTNPALAAILGCGQESLEGSSLRELLGLDSDPRQAKRLAEMLAGARASNTLECEIEREDGSDVAVILNLARAPDGERSGILGVLQMQDITERKRAEEAVRSSQERLEQAEVIARMGTYEWDLRSGRTSRSAGLQAILKLGPENDQETPVQALERVHPDDREHVRAALDRAISALETVSTEYRIVRGDGRVRVLDLRADPIVDEDGVPVRLIAVVHDITESRRAQQALTAASSNLATYAAELEKLAAAADPPAEAPPEKAALSTRQLETLRLVAQGLTNAEIAKRMFVSEATVKWHVQQILSKTNSSNRTEAVVRVLGQGVRAPASSPQA